MAREVGKKMSQSKFNKIKNDDLRSLLMRLDAVAMSNSHLWNTIIEKQQNTNDMLRRLLNDVRKRKTNNNIESD